MSHVATIHTADTLKSVREALCLAQSALLNHWPFEGDRPADRAASLGRLIEDIDRQRPLGPDGVHGDRHTPTCGCEDKEGNQPMTNEPDFAAIRQRVDNAEELLHQATKDLDRYADNVDVYVAVGELRVAMQNATDASRRLQTLENP
jgi:hypothetical protein